MYASPSWCGFTSARERDRMGILINKLKRSDFLSTYMYVCSLCFTLANEAELRLLELLPCILTVLC